MAQRMLACTGCHGPDGRAASDGYYPRIAGKPAGYLFRQLRAFRDGQRPYALMSQLLAPLDDAYLQQIAAHFAALQLPYAPAGRPRRRATLRRGEALVQQGDAARGVPACTACHGAALAGSARTCPACWPAGGLPERTDGRPGARPPRRRIAWRRSRSAERRRQRWPTGWRRPVPAAGQAEAPTGPPPMRCGSMDGPR